MNIDQKTNERQRLSDAMIRRGIPDYMHHGIARHVFEGVPTGDFLTSLLCNEEWSTVLQRADSTNQNLLPAYLLLLYNDVPAQCWGSPEKVQAWRNRFEAVQP